MMPVIREGGPDDLEAVESIQHLCPEAAQWNPRDYLEHDFRVATLDGVIAGFLVVRRVAPEEREILNLAVAPAHRRKGIAGRLLASALQSRGDTFFLEVRESNRTAQEFYKSLGFQILGKRHEYYHSPLESAIVMKFHSC